MSPGPLPARVDFRKLAEQRASVEGTLPVTAFSRLKGLLESDAGEIAIALDFAPGKGRNPRVRGTCSGRVSMLCQNCLEPVEVSVNVTIDAFIVATVDQLIELDQDEDGIVCEGSLMAVVDIVEDELMVGLPMVPRHADGDCAETYEPEPPPASFTDEPETHRPFAGLEALKKDLKRSE